MQNYPRRIAAETHQQRYKTATNPYWKRASNFTSQEKARRSVQDQYLAACQSQSVPLKLQLKNDVYFEGTLRAFDNWTLIIQGDDLTQLIFKSAILRIIPLAPISIDDIRSYPGPQPLNFYEEAARYRDRDSAPRPRMPAI